MKKYGKNPAEFRPDILHQVGIKLLNCSRLGQAGGVDYDDQQNAPFKSRQELLALLDSPLNKVGKLKVYIHTNKNVLIEVNPKCRIPRTFKRFAGLMGEWAPWRPFTPSPVAQALLIAPGGHTHQPHDSAIAAQAQGEVCGR
jgi:hypothetical protein